MDPGLLFPVTIIIIIINIVRTKVLVFLNGIDFAATVSISNGYNVLCINFIVFSWMEEKASDSPVANYH